MTAFIAAPGSSKVTPFNLTATEIVIVAIVAVVGILGILGWRSRNRSPHLDEKVEREEEE
jgi:hypothetical protein